MALAACWLLAAFLLAALPQAAVALPVLPTRPANPQTGATPTDGPAAVAGAASAEKIRTLEQQVQSASAEVQRQQLLLAQTREQLAAAESGNAWLPWLLLGLVVTGSSSAWLALRLRRMKREWAQHRWTAAADDAPMPRRGGAIDLGSIPPLSPDRPLLSPRPKTAPAGAITSPDMASAAGRGTTKRAVGAAPAAGPTLGNTEFSLGSGVPPRPVSAEELLDLDQQVDFFLALGQAQSAIDLLLSRVRSTGGTYALPYFKLLEIYHQQGDDEAYERTRERFNQRFNAFAPEVSGDLQSGRTLEDYPEVVQRLQRAWAHPLRAAAELESLLLRRADLEPFDLPAYRDILMLHALVRDLPAGALQVPATSVTTAALTEPPLPPLPPLPAAAAPEAAVDLLLPLGDEAHMGTAPMVPLSERVSAQAMLAEWVFTHAAQPAAATDGGGAGLRPSRPAERPESSTAVDLDLSDLAPAPREFTRPAAFTDINLRLDGRRSDLGALDGGEARPPRS